ncbi:alpha/beta hydrolase [Roseovarius sp. EL26]|uniref:alpha/beta hydrolase n=1 Tax=Roseovarius sp. EL26 TaxID=2126672 RepID=UPI0013C44244|nr:alpha/beta hydrolase [Roseovarius sp. EL26]
MKKVVFSCVLLALAACGGLSTTGILAPAPNLYTFENGDLYPARGVPKGLRRTTTEILYVTDRQPDRNAAGEIAGYSSVRSDSMAFGVSLVEYGDLQDWGDLVERTHDKGKRGLTRLDPVYLQEIARFPDTPLPIERRGDRLVVRDAAQQAYDLRQDVMAQEIGTRLRKHGLDRVMIYIHGFNNDFDDGVGTLANIWHYSGRQSLPMVYSWPAGSSGPLAYFRDVESGEFSVFHVKEYLRMLASIPEVKTIDIVAHSRGNVVITDALRELLIEARASGKAPRAAMKTGILVMAAPDLDIGVTQQRLVAERFAEAFEQISIYANPEDELLALSKVIGNNTRLGGIDADSFSEAQIQNTERTGTVHYILVEDGSGHLGHSYFRENPAVMSDIVLALRTRQLPGTEFRPLERTSAVTWALHQNYPGEELPEVLDFSGPER